MQKKEDYGDDAKEQEDYEERPWKEHSDLISEEVLIFLFGKNFEEMTNERFEKDLSRSFVLTEAEKEQLRLLKYKKETL